MPVIAAYLHRHGRRVHEIAIDEAVDCPTDRSEFVWIGLTDPCADEVHRIFRQRAVHLELEEEGELLSAMTQARGCRAQVKRSLASRTGRPVSWISKSAMPSPFVSPARIPAA